MGQGIPLIRAAALVPMLKWMLKHGRDTEAALADVQLSWFPWNDPVQPIPLLCAVEFLRNLARIDGPDIPARVVGDTGLFELAMLARVALGARTPREALDRIARTMPYHCSHEVLTVTDGDGDCTVRDHWSLPFDQEARHLVDQYFVAILSVLFGLTEARSRFPAVVSMVPHPAYGMDHLCRHWNRYEIHQTRGPIEMRLPTRIAGNRFRKVARDRMAGIAMDDWSPLRGDATLAASVKLLLPGMLRHGGVGIDCVVGYTGASRRTFQRRLAEEGFRFSDIIDAVRNDMLGRLMDDPKLTIRDMSDQLGYARQSTLTRAAKRWTGNTPSEARRRTSRTN